MQMNDYDSNAVHILYSPTAKYSLGYMGEFMREDERALHAIEANYLAWRQNNFDSQGNIFFNAGLGAAENNSNYKPLAYAGILADWEDRRYFVSYENRATYAENIEETFKQKARIGIAPYIGEAGELHTWFMLQFDNNPGAEDEKKEFVVTPLVRFFKGANMLETGVSDNGDLFINFTKVF